MGTRVILLGLIAACVFSPAARGQGFMEGDNTFNIIGSGSSNDDLDNTTFGMELSLGQFLMNNVSGELRQGLTLTDIPGSDDDWSASTRGALDVYLATDEVCPFLGGSLGYVYGDAVADTWVAGPEGGVKWFVNNTTYIAALVEYEFFFDEGDEVEDAFDDGRFVYSLGVGFKF